MDAKLCGDIADLMAQPNIRLAANAVVSQYIEPACAACCGLNAMRHPGFRQQNVTAESLG